MSELGHAARREPGRRAGGGPARRGEGREARARPAADPGRIGLVAAALAPGPVGRPSRERFPVGDDDARHRAAARAVRRASSSWRRHSTASCTSRGWRSTAASRTRGRSCRSIRRSTSPSSRSTRRSGASASRWSSRRSGAGTPPRPEERRDTEAHLAQARRRIGARHVRATCSRRAVASAERSVSLAAVAAVARVGRGARSPCSVNSRTIGRRVAGGSPRLDRSSGRRRRTSPRDS